MIDLPPIFAAVAGADAHRDLALRFPRAGLVLERADARRAHRHAFRRADPLDHRQGPARERDRYDRAAQFVGPACVIDCDRGCEGQSDFLLTPERVQSWEATHGRIPRGAWVLLRTGWSARTTREDFINAREDGPHSPGFAKACSEFLAHERDVLGVGVETIGTDAGQAGTFDPPFPNHGTMHGAGKFGITSLINLDQLPPTGAVVIAAPLKIPDGSGSPLRVIALAPA